MTIKPTPTHPTFSEEETLHASGYSLVAGVDEVGRGPLAGPVVAAAVILDRLRIPSGLNDSKKLTQSRRETLFGEICATSHVAVASLSAAQIDNLNIRGATLAAMVRAIVALSDTPDFILIDGRDVPDTLTIPAKAIIKGDGHSLSIAAASIVAKVARDNMMTAADKNYPGYDFYKHKGYGSAHHRNAIQRLGPCPLHRRSFQPVKGMMGWAKN